ncbi:NB-ARC domain-containing protein [Streptomyces sp. NPDC059629]|uniref:WD40 domain-containing protein n=1 Tax=Streptomyces sp. NPDC059629 TaxID=3346889 RepID=UPI0036BF8CE9
MTVLLELTECLGDEDAARALLHWAAKVKGMTLTPVVPRWKPSGKGYTGAALTAVTVTPGQGTVVVKLCPADQGEEHSAHSRALQVSRLRGDFAERHLTEQVFDPHPVGDGRQLTFQSPAGASLRNVVTMAHLSGDELGSTFRTVVSGLVNDWNRGVEDRRAEPVTVSAFLRGELGTLIEAAGPVPAYAAGVDALLLDAARAAWITVDGVVVPNPLLMAQGNRQLPDPEFPVVHGLAHSDLHLQNVMVPYRGGVLRPDAYRLIDLADFAETAPLTRDVATLMLSVLAEKAPLGLLGEQELALLSQVVNPQDAHLQHIVPWLAELLDDTYTACTGVVPDGWRDLWSDQLLLSVQATALRFTTYESLGDDRRWRFFRLAAHAGGELLARQDVQPPASGPAVLPPSATGAAAVPDARPGGLAAEAAPSPAPQASGLRRLTDVPHMAPSVTSDFVERPEEGEALVRSLLSAVPAGRGGGPTGEADGPAGGEGGPAAAPAAVGLTSSSVTGVHGTGGFGKTTLAAWACHHPDVLKAFPDGVLWVQLGQDVSQQLVIAAARDLVRLLTGAEPPAYATAEGAGIELGRALEGRRALLVVDDVWRREDMEPLLRGGGGCVRLVTTRRRGVLDASTPLVRIDRMSPAQSLNLLTSGIEGADNTTVLPLFERSGRWPLALGLLNGVLRSMVQRSGMALSDVVDDMVDELRRHGLERPLDTYAESTTRTVEATVDLSLDELARIPHTGRASLARLLAMACFPEDQHIPYRWLSRLWGVTELTARRECVHLDNHSLLAQQDKEGVRLHDVIRDVLRRRDPEAVRRAHRALLDGHAPLCEGQGWHALGGRRADPAFLDHVTYHLAGAGDTRTLDHTTTDFRFLVERVWHSGPSALATEAARRLDVFLPLGMERYATELGELAHAEAHLLAGHARRIDLAVTLYSRCLAAEPVVERLHDAREVLTEGLVARAPFPDGPDGRLWRVLTGHTGPVHALCWRPDGRVLASGGDDGTVRIHWIDEDGRPDVVVDAARGAGAVIGLSWSPDVLLLAVGTDWGEVLLADPSEGRIVRRLTVGYEDRPRVLPAFAPDSAVVAVACGSDVRLWHAPFTDDSLGPPLPGPRDATCTAVSWHARGGLVVGRDDGTVDVWREEAAGEPAVLLTGLAVQDLDWHPDGDLLAVVGHAAKVTLLDFGGTDVALRFFEKELAGAAAQALAWMPSGDTLLAGDDDGTVLVWKLGRQKKEPRLELIDSFSARNVQARAIAPHPHEDLIAVGTRHPAVRLWIPDRRPNLDSRQADRVNTVAWSPQGILAAGDALGRLLVAPGDIAGPPVASPDAVHTHGGEALAWTPGQGGELRALAWAPDGRRLLSVGDDGLLLLWDADRRDVLRTPARKLAYPAAVAWSPDGRWAAAGDDTEVLLWETTDWRRVHTIPLGAGVNALAFAPTEPRLAVATSSRELRVVRLDETGRPTGTVGAWEGHLDSVTAVAWSPDSRHLATGGYGGHVLLWDPATGLPRRLLEGDGSAVSSVALSRNGDRLVAVTVEGSAFLWDTATEAEVCRLRVDNNLSSCSFHPDDDRVVLGGSAGLYLCEVLRQGVRDGDFPGGRPAGSQRAPASRADQTLG